MIVGLSMVELIQSLYTDLSGGTWFRSQARAAANSALPPFTEEMHFSDVCRKDPETVKNTKDTSTTNNCTLYSYKEYPDTTDLL